MNSAACTIVVEPLADGTFRASCHLLPDQPAVAATPEAARQQVEEALARYVRDQLNPSAAGGPGPS